MECSEDIGLIGSGYNGDDHNADDNVDGGGNDDVCCCVSGNAISYLSGSSPRPVESTTLPPRRHASATPSPRIFQDKINVNVNILSEHNSVSISTLRCLTKPRLLKYCTVT